VRRFPDLAGDAHRLAVEVRHPAFFDGVAGRNLDRILAEAGAERITLDTTTVFAAPPTSDAEREAWERKPRLPVHRDAVGDRPVVRYIGRDDPAATVAGWQPWLPVVARWLDEGRTPTVFVHTPDNVDAVILARLFHDQVRVHRPALAPLPAALTEPQATLF
jgi:uncharacterized protein YecE (DUF72 family)